jgi:DNA helicase II / ATP-dependent DNA helicase PcrA
MLTEIPITDAEIDQIEHHWSTVTNERFTFDEERRRVLSQWSSCDVQACPGSGKTTTLVAKLLLLLRKLAPGQGVCVLSHTNTARQEVIHKLGKDAASLLKPPHFIGTIQTFVNQYLAISGALEQFGRRPWAIDDAAYESRCRKHYLDLPQSTRSLLDRNAGGHGEGWRYLANLRFSVINPGKIVSYSNDQEQVLKHGGRELGGHTDTYVTLSKLKNKISQEGCLAFHDAFAVGLEYLNRYPGLKAIFAKRFAFVFLDEVQDTDTTQGLVIQEIFSNRVHVHRFGDQNQSIFRGNSEVDMYQSPTTSKHLTINSTMRLSPSIAQLGQRFGVNPQPLNSQSKIADLPHTIFLFSNPEAVLPAYSKLISSHPFASSQNSYAVGSVGKPKDDPQQLTICSYFPKFAQTKPAPRPESFLAHIIEAQRVLDETKFCGAARQILVDGLVQLLRKQGITRPDRGFYTAHSFEAQLRSMSPTTFATFRKTLFQWVYLLTKSVPFDLKQMVTEALELVGPLLIQDLSKSARSFLDNETLIRNEGYTESNVFQAHGVRIKLGTIHSVKGQTHDATLLLDTHYHGSELKALLPILLGERPKKQLKEKRFPQRMRRAYVALTRARNLVCLAMHKEIVDTSTRLELTKVGWVIQEIE